VIPLRDVIPSRTTPVVTITLVVLNALIFLYELSLGDQVNDFIFAFGLVPAYFAWPNVLTSMFLHGGFLHAAGNMLYLWIFGDNVTGASWRSTCCAASPPRSHRRSPCPIRQSRWSAPAEPSPA
jgi:membrane associated rhomboid family serine protease